jgi:cytochrome c oxidase subunit 2
MRVSRRQFCRAGMAAAAAAGMGTVAYVAAQPAEQSIGIEAKKFEFLPETVTVKQGVPVLLAITNTSDVVMGFSAPDFKVRADLPAGKTVQIRLLPQTTGTFDYVCDVFCGSGHEDMGGSIAVVA